MFVFVSVSWFGARCCYVRIRCPQMIASPSNPLSFDFVAYEHHFVREWRLRTPLLMLTAATSKRRPPAGIVITTACFYVVRLCWSLAKKLEGPAADECEIGTFLRTVRGGELLLVLMRCCWHL